MINIPALVQIMVWRWSGDKPLFKPMMASLLTHICVNSPRWVKRTRSAKRGGSDVITFHSARILMYFLFHVSNSALFLHNTLVRSFCIDIVLTLSMAGRTVVDKTILCLSCVFSYPVDWQMLDVELHLYYVGGRGISSLSRSKVQKQNSFCSLNNIKIHILKFRL